MTLKWAEVTREVRDFPVELRKRRVVSGRSHPLVVGDLKMRSLTLRSSKEKAFLATLSNE